MLITQEKFKMSWLGLHQEMDVAAEVNYYWELYQKLWGKCCNSEQDEVVMVSVFRLLLHIEDMAHLKLGEAFMKEYRIAGDFVKGITKRLNLNESQSNAVQIDVFLGIKYAPESGMKAYMKDAFYGNDFKKLCKATWWMTEYNQPLASIFPDKEVCSRHLYNAILPEDDDGKDVAQVMSELWLAFSWRDKQGMSIAKHMQRCLEADLGAGPCDPRNFEMSFTDVEKFKVSKGPGNGKVTLTAPKDLYMIETFNVDLPHPLIKDYKDCRLLGTVVLWKGQAYLCGPYLWITKEEAENYDSQDFTMGVRTSLGVYEQIEEVTLSTGEKFFKYEDVASEGSFTWIGKSKLGDDRTVVLRLSDNDDDSRQEYDFWEANPDFKPLKEPNYGFRPKGKNPEAYFERKIKGIRDYVDDFQELAMDFYEGWLAQAHKYNNESDISFALTIVQSVFWEAISFYEDEQDEFDCKSRMSKMVRECWLLWLDILKKGKAEWLPEALDTLTHLKDVKYDLFRPRAPFSVDNALREVRAMMKQAE